MNDPVAKVNRKAGKPRNKINYHVGTVTWGTENNPSTIALYERLLVQTLIQKLKEEGMLR